MFISKQYFDGIGYLCGALLIGGVARLIYLFGYDKGLMWKPAIDADAMLEESNKKAHEETVRYIDGQIKEQVKAESDEIKILLVDSVIYESQKAVNESKCDIVRSLDTLVDEAVYKQFLEKPRGISDVELAYIDGQVLETVKREVERVQPIKTDKEADEILRKFVAEEVARLGIFSHIGVTVQEEVGRLGEKLMAAVKADKSDPVMLQKQQPKKGAKRR